MKYDKTQNRSNGPKLSSTIISDNASRHGQYVKGQIISAGIKLSNLAEAAGLAPCTLSSLLTGRSRCRQNQVLIWDAFVQMTRSTISLSDFWGELLSGRIAG
jgi:lambda repressor-like predicted transcriptional regulator